MPLSDDERATLNDIAAARLNDDPLYVHDDIAFQRAADDRLHNHGPSFADKLGAIAHDVANDILNGRDRYCDLRSAVIDYRSACDNWTGSAASSARADEAQRLLFELVADDGE